MLTQQIISKEMLKNSQNELFFQNGGGVAMPVAGAIYWMILSYLGTYLAKDLWILAACIGSGLIFPLALLLAKPLKCNVMNRDHPLSGVAFPVIIAMNLLWPLYFIAVEANPDIMPLALAIGMSIVWPVIGWSYGRTLGFTVHALFRCFLVSIIWTVLPEERFTLLPLSVSLIYMLTVAWIYYELKPKAEKVAA